MDYVIVFLWCWVGFVVVCLWKLVDVMDGGVWVFIFVDCGYNEEILVVVKGFEYDYLGWV